MENIVSQSAPRMQPTLPKGAAAKPALSPNEAASIKKSNRQKENLAKKREKLAAKRALMATRPKPTEGLPLLIYGLKRLWQIITGGKWEFVNPKMTRHDRAKHDVLELGEKLNEIAMSIVEFVLTVVNTKGGAGKTPLLAYLASVYAAYSNNPTVALDLNQNEGTLHNMFGMLRNMTLTLGRALKMRAELVNWKAIAPKMKAHIQTGVRVMASEDIDLKAIEVSVFDELIDGMRNASQLVAIDTGNGKGYAANRSAVSNANAVVYATLWGKEDTFEGIASTIRGYLVRGMHEQIFNRSFMVVSGTPRNMTKEQVYDAFVDHIFSIWGLLEKDITEERKMQLMTDPEAQAERKAQLMQWLGIRLDRFYIVPESAYIKKMKVVDVRASVIGLETLRAYLQILVDIFKHAQEVSAFDAVAFDAVQSELSGLEDVYTAWKEEHSLFQDPKAQSIDDLDPLDDSQHPTLTALGRSSS